MIIDSHCHAWAHWPYEPPVPDPDQRGRVEQLLFEMDQNGVDRALIVCAQIDHNPTNNRYVAQQVTHHQDRLYQVADLDSSWSATYHRPGAADRLRAMTAQWPLTGFTHYLARNDDGWLDSDEADGLFTETARQGLLASIAASAHHIAGVCRLAQRYPQVPVLLHHLASARAAEPETMEQILTCKAVDNVHIKVSGFYYGTAGPKWAYPHGDMHEIVRCLYDELGPHRLCWGSDYPVSRQFITYRQALEGFRTHCDFIPPADQAQILGGTLAALLDR